MANKPYPCEWALPEVGGDGSYSTKVRLDLDGGVLYVRDESLSVSQVDGLISILTQIKEITETPND